MSKGKITIIGAGSWGTALAIAYGKIGPACLWARDPRHVDAMATTRMNQRYLSHFTFPERLVVSSDLKSSVLGSSVVIVATPVSGFREALQRISPWLSVQPVLWACKGVERSGVLLSEIATAHLSTNHTFGVISGPSFASGVARGDPTALVLATNRPAETPWLSEMMCTDTVRVYATDDLVGVQMGGALKNVYAIGAGLLAGSGYGPNALAALISRALAEMTRLCTAMGGNFQTMLGLSGVGDLHLTCSNRESRNFRLGCLIGNGQKLSTAVNELGHVAEGTHTAEVAERLADQFGQDMPIAKAIARVLRNEISVEAAVALLMRRSIKAEFTSQASLVEQRAISP